MSFCVSSPTRTHTWLSSWGRPVHPPHRQPARAAHRRAGPGMDPLAARPAHRTRAILVCHRRCRVQQGRWCDRTGASGPVGRPCDGGLRGFAVAPRPRHRDQRVEGTDPVRLDHPRPVSSRAVHRALEHQLHPRRGSGRISARGPAPQPPGDRRHPAGYAAVCDNAALTAALSSVTRRRPHRLGLRAAGRARPAG
jgi:hypothetical protein